jgi:small subunit ribosomal protein S20
MPITSSAIKKSRQDVKSREHNRGLRDEYKKAVKTVKSFVDAGETKKAQEALKEAYSKLDRAAKKNVLHKNNAARRKSRLSSLLSTNKVVKTATPKAANKKKSPAKAKKTTKK